MSTNLEALAICDAATPGPWSSGWDDPESEDDDEWPLIRAGRDAVIAGVWYDGPRAACVRENAAFIVAARTGYPEALRRVADLEADPTRDKLIAALQRMEDTEPCNIVDYLLNLLDEGVKDGWLKAGDYR